ncbi:hypothetical protein NX059_011635 [Plenodomus lindquistii]|nr:hypothetical protein NX059_011635 [Plenodomus lindquistii]
MGTAARYPNEAPGLYSPSSSLGRREPYTTSLDTNPRCSSATETSGRQVTGTADYATHKRIRDGAPSFWDSNSLTNSRGFDARSPPPLAHDRYELARGGMDDTSRTSRQNGDYDDYFQLQKQRGSWSVPPTPYGGAVKRPAEDEMMATPNGGKSWSIMGLVGGVAGKLFQFCTVPFRGFQAGSGPKYKVDSQHEIAAKLGLHDGPSVFQFTGAVQQMTPSDSPADDYGVRSLDSVQDERPRMAKRLRTADSWVVVGNNGETKSRPSTPRLAERRIPDHRISPSHIPRPISRAGTSTPSAKRPSLIPVSRRSTMDRTSFLSSPHTRQRSYSRQSYGSPIAPEDPAKNRKSPFSKSPLPQESQRLINRVRQEELEEDARMRRMSSQMSAMLKEAQEALGSKFNVDEYRDDEDMGRSAYAQQQPTWFS